MLLFFLKKSECAILRNGSLFLFLLNDIGHLLAGRQEILGLLWKHGMVQLCLTAALTQANIFIFLFLIHFLSPKSGIPD